MITPATPSSLRVSLIFPTSEPDAIWSSVITPGLSSVPGLASVGAAIVATAAAEYATNRTVTRVIPLASLPMLFPGATTGRLILTIHAYQLDGFWVGEILVYSDSVSVTGLQGVFSGALVASGFLQAVETDSRGVVQWHRSPDGKVVLAQPLTPQNVYPVTPAS